jgi:Predicted membrane protein (DUF2306)
MNPMSAILGSTSPQRAPAAPGFTSARSAQQWLTRAATTWVVVALVGQLIFSTYVTVVYGTAAVTGDTTRWNHVMPKGYVPGDTPGNAAIMSHVLLAVLIIVGGALQLMPAIRRRLPVLHRWVGRGYVIAVSLTSLAGLYMVWVRGSVGDLSQHVAISLNAIILMVCAMLAWRTARARDYTAHRRWALRAWLAANGVVFFRFGLFLWLVVNQGPAGFDPKTFTGPFLTLLAFGVYVVGPLTLLQGYFVARERPGVWAPRLATAGLFLLALLTAAGAASVTMILWVPAMR